MKLWLWLLFFFWSLEASFKKVLPEVFASKVRSKQDLYKLLTLELIRDNSNIVHYLFLPYNMCPLHYLRKVLNRQKKISFCLIICKDVEADSYSRDNNSSICRTQSIDFIATCERKRWVDDFFLDHIKSNYQIESLCILFLQLFILMS